MLRGACAHPILLQPSEIDAITFPPEQTNRCPKMREHVSRGERVQGTR